jgi:type III restriction enzyme
MIELRNYQISAVERLMDTFESLLRSSENEICIFQAPTGSGKTIMMAEFLKKLVKDRKDQRKFSFIWISVRRLHDQSKDKLERCYENNRLLKCSYFEDLEDKKIGENEILFINWDSINKKDINIYVRENEQDNNLNSIIKNTKEDGREIILVIDESHHTAGSEKSRELIEVIGPKITIEVSATPHLTENVSGIVKVNLSEVKEEEMIKTEISVNPEFIDIKIGSQSADELVIGQALKKREESAKMYKREDSKVNPLVLIQLPDKREGMEDKKEEIVKILKNKFDVTEENGKLAIWLSEDKSDTLPNIEKMDNEVEVLIFKQAIALGWDCPRASILVIFRESKSFVFTIQTIGRIMRMPELKHYTQEPELNKGFVFTNLPNIEITEEYAKDYVTIYESKRRNEKIYKNIELNSVYLKRQRERTRLSGEFVKIFVELAAKTRLKDKITLKPSKIVSPVIADGKIIDIDKIGEIEHKGTIDIRLTEKELKKRWDSFISANCTPFAPADSSDRMKTALYQFFNKEFKLEKYDPKVQKIILGKENVQAFVDAINLAKEQYKTKVVDQFREKREVQPVSKWEVPIIISYNSKYKQTEHEKSIMKPLYIRTPSEPEKKFMELLDKSNKIKWWFRNGEGEIKYFAILYEDENGFERAFYADFIVMFKDGKIGLFDTKSGMTAKDAMPRAEGLQKYIKAENKKDKKLWGGIVIYVNRTWRYNDEEKYHYDPNNLSNWKILEI